MPGWGRPPGAAPRPDQGLAVFRAVPPGLTLGPGRCPSQLGSVGAESEKEPGKKSLCFQLRRELYTVKNRTPLAKEVFYRGHNVQTGTTECLWGVPNLPRKNPVAHPSPFLFAPGQNLKSNFYLLN